MTKLAIIGGSGLSSLNDFQQVDTVTSKTPYGQPSSPLVFGKFGQLPVVFLPRHGVDHSIPPHRINYRANMYALHQAGVEDIIAVAAVGGINPTCLTKSLVIPNQIIDYTWGREHTYFDGKSYVASHLKASVEHIDFTLPFDEHLRLLLINAAKNSKVDVITSGCYGVTQGPRLETTAEIIKMERDGADLVGMTAMPEAALARELGMKYAGISMVVNAAAGKGFESITMDQIVANLSVTTGMTIQLLRCLAYS